MPITAFTIAHYSSHTLPRRQLLASYAYVQFAWTAESLQACVSIVTVRSARTQVQNQKALTLGASPTVPAPSSIRDFHMLLHSPLSVLFCPAPCVRVTPLDCASVYLRMWLYHPLQAPSVFLSLQPHLLGFACL